jgi:hypothetical protein
MNSRVLRVILCLVCLLALVGCETAPASTTVPTTVPTTAPIETTAPETVPTETVSEWELAYDEILTDLAETLGFRLSPTFEADYNDGKEIPLSDGLKESLNSDLAYNWHCMLVEMVWSDAGEVTEKEAYGYVLQDINGDGSPELFWIRSDGFILAVFTIVDGAPRLVDAFWPRHRAVVTPSGELYTRSSGGAMYIEYYIRSLAPGSAELTNVVEFGLEDGKYYEVVDGQRKTVTEARFQELLTEKPFENQMNWEITPL